MPAASSDRASAEEQPAPRRAAETARRRNPRGEGGRLREQLLQATVDVLGEVGDADKVSVRAIARRAGVSPTALYLQFPDRDALVTAAVDAGFAAFNEALSSAVAAPRSARERLAAMGIAYLAFSERQPALYAILFASRRPLLDKSENDRESGFEGLVTLLQEVDTTLARDDARQLALHVWSSLHGFAMLRTVRPHFEWPDAETYIRRLMAAHGLDEDKPPAGALDPGSPRRDAAPSAGPRVSA